MGILDNSVLALAGKTEPELTLFWLNEHDLWFILFDISEYILLDKVVI